MEIEDLVRILSEQLEEVLESDMSEFCSRMEENQLSLTSNLAQVVIGVRRCGKSTLCMKYLVDNKVKFGYASLDDERFDGIQTSDLNKLLEAIYVINGDVDYLFFDEIQNADAWPLFVNRILRQHKHVFLTGRNSKLLSNELMTHLTGRHNQVALYPFSFKEFCAMNHVDCKGVTTKAIALRVAALHNYIEQGGMPELLHETNKRKYIDSLMNTIIRNDIAKRFKIRNVDVLHKIATCLCDNFAHEVVPTTLAKQFNVTPHTAGNYFRYLKEAFLLVGIPKFSFKPQERVRNEKCYVVDTAFPSEHTSGLSLENLGWKLENVVCLELLRRNTQKFNDIYYYKDGTSECDFVVAHNGNVLELIQVCYDISSVKTRKREVNGLFKAAEKLHCEKLTLITFENKETINNDGHTINVVGAADWLLSD